MMKLSILAVAMSGVAAISPVAAANLVTNGSFESFTTTPIPSPNVFSGPTYNAPSNWTLTANNGSDAAGFPPTVVTYGGGASYPSGAFGEALPVDNAVSASPDAVGTHGLYFVADTASPQTLSQSITFATTGLYQFGFDYYVPQNGFNNPNDASLSFTLNNVTVGATLTTGSVTSNTTCCTWRNFSTTRTVAAGTYMLGFNYNALGPTAADFVVDRVYVQSVPEPATWGLMIVGFGLVGAATRRRRVAIVLN